MSSSVCYQTPYQKYKKGAAGQELGKGVHALAMGLSWLAVRDPQVSGLGFRSE